MGTFGISGQTNHILLDNSYNTIFDLFPSEALDVSIRKQDDIADVIVWKLSNA